MSDAGVTTKEIDLSTSIPSFPGVYGGIVISAKKGPVNTPVLVTSDTDLLNRFTPDARVEVGMDLAYFSALAFLQRSNQLWVVRAASAAKYAGLSLKKAGSLYASFMLSSGMLDPTAYLFDSAADVVAAAQVVSIVCLADSSGSLNNTYFLISTTTTNYYVWFNVGGSGVDPALSGKMGVEVAIAQNATATQVAQAIAAALVGVIGAFGTGSSSATASVTNTVAGATLLPASDFNTGFSINTTTPGANAINVVDEATLIYAANQGVWGNAIGVKVTNYVTAPDKVKEPGAFMIEVFKSSNLSTPIETFVCSRNPSALDGYGKNMYIENVLNSSNYIRAIDNVAVDSNLNPKDQTTILYLGGGNDGLAVSESQMIEAANTLASSDEIPLTLLMDGGFATPAYGLALDSICQARGDCVALLSVPFSAEASATYLQDISDYRKADLNLNSSFSTLVSPHVLVYDRFNDRRIYVAPDGYMGAAISFSASNFEIWYPPAGFKRGLIQVLDVRRRFNKTERGALYDIGVNPIRFTPGKGIAIWGQKTLLSRPSALDRLNVRLMLVVVEPAVAAALEDFSFEFNDPATRALIEAIINSYMTKIQARKGVSDFKVICDESNNTAADIDANELNCDLYVKPLKSAEFITFRVVITSQGLSFDQAAAAV